MKNRNLGIRACVAACLASVALGVAAGEADPRSWVVTLNIQAQPITAALNELGQQSGIQVLFNSNATDSRIEAPALMGTFTLDEVLRKLAAEAGLTYSYVNNRTVVISTARNTPPKGTIGSGLNKGAAELRLANFRQVSEQPTQSAAAASANNQSSANSQSSRTDSRDERGPLGMEGVVVTAQKREEQLQDVPIAIAVLSGSELDSSTAQGMTDELNRVPGVSTTTLRAVGTTRVVIRGVGTIGAFSAGAGAVGYYLDTIPFGLNKHSLAPDANAYDLDRVEVLRGPQGTLYGASALNGVVRVLTKDADLNEYEFKARTSVSSTEGGDNSYRGDAALNVPLIDGKLGARAVVGYQDLGGWIEKPMQRDANGAQLTNARLKLNAQPTDDLSIGMFAWLSRAHYDNPSTGPENLRRELAQFQEPNDIDYNAYALKVGYDANAVEITSSTSYLDYFNDGYFDYLPIGLPDALLNTRQESRVFSQEVVLNSTAEGPWRWSLGGIYRDGTERLYQTVRVYPAPTDLDSMSESFAVFGEVTRAFLDGRFELTAGLRYFEDKITDEEHARITGEPPEEMVTIRDKFNSTTPRVVLTWHAAEQAMVYASYSEGFRSGVNQFPAVTAVAPQFPSVDPDSLKNYEVGMKGGFWGGRLTLETAVYFIDWQDVQQVLSVEVVPSVIFPALVNGESASGVGIDFAARVAPLDGLTLGLNFSWNELTVDREVVTGGAVLFPTGSRLNGSPETTAGVTADYTFPIGESSFDGTFSVAANYVSGQDNRLHDGFTVVDGPGDAITMGRVSFSLNSSNNWMAALFVDNVTNENGIVLFDVFSPEWHSRVRPRTFGLQFEYSY